MSTDAPNDPKARPKIYWTVLLRVTKDAKARKLLARIEAALGLSLQDVTFQPWEDDPALYEAEFWTPVPASCVALGDVVIESLMQASRLYPAWSVDAWELRYNFFAGVARWPQSRFTIVGVEYVRFAIGDGEVGIEIEPLGIGDLE